MKHKGMFRRLLSVLLCLTMVFSLLPTSALAEGLEEPVAAPGEEPAQSGKDSVNLKIDFVSEDGAALAEAYTLSVAKGAAFEGTVPFAPVGGYRPAKVEFGAVNAANALGEEGVISVYGECANVLVTENGMALSGAAEADVYVIVTYVALAAVEEQPAEEQPAAKDTVKDALGQDTLGLDSIALANKTATVEVGKDIDLYGNNYWRFHTWESGNEAVATVVGNGSSAKVTGVAAGETTITRKNAVGNTETWTVTVKEAAPSAETTRVYVYIRLDGDTQNINYGSLNASGWYTIGYVDVPTSLLGAPIDAADFEDRETTAAVAEYVNNGSLQLHESAANKNFYLNDVVWTGTYDAIKDDQGGKEATKFGLHCANGSDGYDSVTGRQWHLDGYLKITHRYTLTVNYVYDKAYTDAPGLPGTYTRENLKYGESHTFDVPDVPGFSYTISSDGATVNGKTATMGNQDAVVTVTYTRNVYTVTGTIDNGTVNERASSDTLKVNHGEGAELSFEAAKGYKISSITVNGVEQKITDTKAYTYNNTSVTGNVIVAVTTEIDDSQKKSLSATVDYKLGGEVQTDAHIDLTATVQVLEPDTLSTEGVPTKTFTGWKLDNITVNGEAVEKLPETVNNGDAVVYNYVKDDSQTKPTEYTVKHIVDGVEKTADTKTYKSTAWVNDNPAMIAIVDGSLAQNTYTGYKFASISVADGTTEVESGTVITLTYVKDDNQTQATKYTVHYTINGVEQETDKLEVNGTAWVLDNPAQIAIAEGGIPAPADKYEGYKLDEANPVYPAAGEKVNSGSEYTVNYVNRTDLSYTVHYYLNGTTESVAYDKIVGGQTFQTTATETPIAVDGYTPVSTDSKNTTIKVDGNEIIFYYYKNLTLTANSDIVVYDGNAKTVTGFTGAPEGVTFTGVNAARTETAAGSYPVNFTGVELNKTVDDSAKYIVTATNPGTLTIVAQSIDPEDPREPDPENPDQPVYGGVEVGTLTDEVYNGQSWEKKPTVTDKDGHALVEDTDYTVTFSEDTTNVGKVTVTVTGIGNYTGSVERTYNITPKPVTVTTETATKVYDGAALTAPGKIEGIVEGETYTFKVTGAQTEAGDSKNTYSLVWNGSAKESNYTVSESIGTLTVTAKTIVPDPDPENPNGMTVDSPSNSVYDGAEHKFVPVVKDGEKTLVEGTDYEVSYDKNDFTNVTGIITVTVTGIGNYTGSVERTYEITKRPVALSSAADSKAYDGTALTRPDVTVTGDGFVTGEVTDIKATGSVTNVAEGEVTNAITYTESESFNANNYEITKNEGKLSIKPAAVTVTADNKTKTFGTNDPELTAAVTGLVGEDTVAYTLIRAEGETVGEYTITPAGDAAQGNYKVTYVPGTLTITAQSINPVDPENPDPNYNGVEVGTLTDEVYNGQSWQKAPTVTDKDGKALTEGTDYTLAWSADTVNVGTVTVTVTGKGNYAGTVERTYRITPATVIVTADSKAKTFNTADPALTATVTGLIGTDTVEYTLARAAGEDVGNYAITAAGAETQGNYIVRFVPGTMVITGFIDDPPVVDIPELPPLPEAIDDELTPLDGPQVTVDDPVNIDDEATPLAGEHECCILHFLILCAALLIELLYINDKKKRQQKIFEMRRELNK